MHLNVLDLARGSRHLEYLAALREAIVQVAESASERTSVADRFWGASATIAATDGIDNKEIGIADREGPESRLYAHSALDGGLRARSAPARGQRQQHGLRPDGPAFRPGTNSRHHRPLGNAQPG